MGKVGKTTYNNSLKSDFYLELKKTINLPGGLDSHLLFLLRKALIIDHPMLL